MRRRSQSPQWSIPGVGVLQPCFDRVTVVSSASVGALNQLLPVAALAKAAHSFTINTYTGRDPHLRSRIIAVGTQTSSPWSLLASNAHSLRQYRVTQAEIAFDMRARSVAEARKTMLKLIGLLAKPRHQRDSILTVHMPHKSPPPGCTTEPTFYFEGCKSSVKLKSYVRYQKLPGGGFGDPCVRLEWTLTGKPALTRHLGGNQIKHLIAADLNEFLRRNIRLERAKHVALGNLLCGNKNLKNLSKDPEKAAFLILRRLAYQELDALGGDSQLAVTICQNSPAQIRGYCRQLRDRKHQKKHRRPKNRQPSSRRPITDCRINACFDRVDLIPTV